MTRPTHAPLTLCELEDPGIPGLESYSPFCLKAHRALRAAGLDYTRRFGSRPASFKKYNTAGQVPVLLVGEEPVADSTAILRKIQEIAPGALALGDARADAEAWLWEDYADSCLNGFLVAARWADDRNWPSVKVAYFKKMPGIIRAIVPGRVRAQVIKGLVARDVWRAGPEKCWERFEAALDQLEARAPADGFWVGKVITVADIAIFAQLHSMRSPLTAWQRDAVARRKRLTAYLDRVDASTSSARVEAAAKAA
jgi:glutathione S-transferase